MNILIPDSWLKEHLKTRATPKQVTEYLSLCSQSVEKTTKSGDDWIYDIEITTNRPDCLSVYGIARELAAILPQFNLEVELKKITETQIDFPQVKESLPLEVIVKNQSLCPRFTALIFDQIQIRPSPKIVQDRLVKSGIRALNNVVDISNYLMLELGQPMHTFDYDKVLGAKMILRESVEGEKIVTLDDQSRNLPKGTIVIEDGEGRVIDLCGIMGGANSEVDQNTKRVLLFVQTYDPVRIRKSCQAMAFRTEAAARFEKGVEPEGVIPAMKKAMVMFEKNCQARVANKLIDFYPNPSKPQKVTLTQEKLNQLMGIEIKLSEAKKILDSLGFHSLLFTSRSSLVCTVPHWRQADVTIAEDLVEEVARIYGYHQLPTNLPAGEIPQGPKNMKFYWEEKTKDILKGWGLNETATYSMISQIMLENIGYQPKNYLQIANPLNQDLLYMRPSLIPSLLQAISLNQSCAENVNLFELAHVYLPRGKAKLPEERMFLTIVSGGSGFYKVKGIVEALLTELGIKRVDFEPCQTEQKISLWSSGRTALIKRKNKRLGIIGEIQAGVLKAFNITGKVIVVDFDFETLCTLATTTKTYHLIPKFPAVIEDLAFFVQAQTPVGKIIKLIKSVSPINSSKTKTKDLSQLHSVFVKSVKLLDSFNNTRTFRVEYQSLEKNLTEKEVKKIRKKIIEKVEKELNSHLKEKG